MTTPTLAKRSTLPPITIANNASLSGASGDVSGLTLVGLYVSGWATSAVMSFKVSTASGGTYYPVMNNAGVYTIADPNAVGSGTCYVALDPSVFAGVQFFKVLSGTGSGTNQSGGTVTITPVVRHLA